MSAYSDYKSGCITESQYRHACRQEQAFDERTERDPNPCKGCPNFEIQEAEDGAVAYCLLGNETCDRYDGDEPDRTERSRILRAVGRYIQTQHEEHGLSALGVNGTVYAVEDILKELDAIIREEEGEA